MHNENWQKSRKETPELKPEEAFYKDGKPQTANAANWRDFSKGEYDDDMYFWEEKTNILAEKQLNDN